MITVHHLDNSRSQRILWMLEELGTPYEIKRYEREATMQAPASLRAVHPLGKSPVIGDGDRTLAESGAILEYLAETYGGGKFSPPAGTPERLHYTYFMHYAEGSLMPLLFMKLVFGKLPSRVPFFMRPVARAIANGADKTLLGPQIANHFAFLEGELAKREWFAGASFSAADIQMSFPLEAAAARSPLFARLPKLEAFVDRVHARPAYKRAVEKGGRYELLKWTTTKTGSC
jgi:glutathione S-transferase